MGPPLPRRELRFIVELPFWCEWQLAMTNRGEVSMRPSRRPASPRLSDRGGNKSALSWRADSGATAVEYGIIAGLLAVTIVVGVQISGNGLNRMFQVIGTTMSNATNSADSSTASN